MSIQNIGIGLVANDGLGDSIRDAFSKTNLYQIINRQYIEK